MENGIKPPKNKIYDAPAYPMGGRLLGLDKPRVTLTLEVENADIVDAEHKPSYLMMAGHVLMIPGVLRGRN